MKIAYANTFINSPHEVRERGEQATRESCFSMFRKITSGLCMFQSRRNAGEAVGSCSGDFY